MVKNNGKLEIGTFYCNIEGVLPNGAKKTSAHQEGNIILCKSICILFAHLHILVMLEKKDPQ